MFVCDMYTCKLYVCTVISALQMIMGTRSMSATDTFTKMNQSNTKKPRMVKVCYASLTYMYSKSSVNRDIHREFKIGTVRSCVLSGLQL